MAQLQATTVNGTLSVTGTITGSGTSLNSIPGTAFVNGAVTNDKIADNTIARNKIGYAGAVLQTLVIRFDARPSFSAPSTTGIGGILTSLRLTITPLYANSLIICEWFIQGETGDHNQGFRVARNGGLVTGTFASFNTNTGQNNHSYINSEGYDNNDSSTPNGHSFIYYDFPNTTSSVFYEPACNSSDGGTRTFFLNRPVGSAGTNNHENGVSFGRITEIRQ